MNWIDILILAVIIILFIEGFFAGMVRKVAQIAGIVAALLMASYYYARLADFIIKKTTLPEGTAGIISFILIFLIVFAFAGIIGRVISIFLRFAPLKFFDKIGGALIGLASGVVVSGAIILLILAFPVINTSEETIRESLLGSPSVMAVEKVYSFAENSLPADIPRIAYSPESIQGEPEREGRLFGSRYRLVDFSGLDNSTCIKCEGIVKYLGYQKNKDDNISPKFTCRNCARTSDGCQTFEGHHLLYDRCPEIMGIQGYRTDCGVWPNNDFIRVTLSCPVCR